jgi:hypothetical protein
LHAIDADFQAQEGGELLVHAREHALAIDAQHRMPMVELFQQAIEFAADSFMFADAEDLGNLVGAETKHPTRRNARRFCGSGSISGR